MDASIRVAAPALRIVTEDEWQAAHARLTAARGIYMKGTKGQAFGRPMLGNRSKYLLTNIALCGCCGGPLKVCSRRHGRGRKFFYGCTWHRTRGNQVCANTTDVPITDADEIVIEALLDDVIDESIVRDSVNEALRLIEGTDDGGQVDSYEGEIAKVERERTNYLNAIAHAPDMPGLLEKLRDCDRRRQKLENERQVIAASRPIKRTDQEHSSNER